MLGAYVRIDKELTKDYIFEEYADEITVHPEVENYYDATGYNGIKFITCKASD